MITNVLFVIQKPTPLLSKNTRGLGLPAAFGAFAPVPQRTRRGPPVLLLYESISGEEPVHVSPDRQSVETEQARHPSPLHRLALYPAWLLVKSAGLVTLKVGLPSDFCACTTRLARPESVANHVSLQVPGTPAQVPLPQLVHCVQSELGRVVPSM